MDNLCLYCKKELSIKNGLNYCNNCKIVFLTYMACSKCGKVHGLRHTFCSDCNLELDKYFIENPVSVNIILSKNNELKE